MIDLAVELKLKSKITDEEMQSRRDSLRRAKAHNRIEGQYPSLEGEAIFEAFIRGDIEHDEILPRLNALRRQARVHRQFDPAHLKAIHRHLFQDVYEWAGHTRDERVKLSDGAIANGPFLRKFDGEPFMQGR